MPIADASCPNQDCMFYGKPGRGNIKYKSKKAKRYYCSTCKTSFSTEMGSFLYNLKTPTSVVLRCIAKIADGEKLRKTAREEHVTTDSIMAWFKKAKNHLHEVSSLLGKELALTHDHIEQIKNFVTEK